MKTKKYKIKEAFYTLQGEGFHSGRPAVFCRFTGCNLWTGLEKDRQKAICKFCDTDFVGMDGENGGSYTAEELTQLIVRLWNNSEITPFVVFTGGEPLLQLNEKLIKEAKKENIEIAVETNGTILPPQGIDWLCVSPKAGSEMIVQQGQELKLVYPQDNALPNEYEHLNFDHFYLQAMDSEEQETNLIKTIKYCKSHPKWKLSLQTHKILNIP